MELELCLALPNHAMEMFDLHRDGGGKGKGAAGKRPFSLAFERNPASLRTLQLLWSPSPPSDDGGGPDFLHHELPKEKTVVGWPPIKSWRQRHCGGCTGTVAAAAAGAGYVKVKMDGVAIGRKIDLAACDSYQTLLSTLSCMFGIEHNPDRRYSISYQDRDGDWLPVEEAPWGEFIGSVQRLKIQKRGG